MLFGVQKTLFDVQCFARPSFCSDRGRTHCSGLRRFQGSVLFGRENEAMFCSTLCSDSLFCLVFCSVLGNSECVVRESEHICCFVQVVVQMLCFVQCFVHRSEHTVCFVRVHVRPNVYFVQMPVQSERLFMFSERCSMPFLVWIYVGKSRCPQCHMRPGMPLNSPCWD